MEEFGLVCKTNNNVSPIGKRRLFLSYAYEDKELMLSKIKYLLSLSDTAVYYFDHVTFKDIDPKQAQELIKDMDIYVPIVTKNYLKDSCFELKHLFPLMKKHNKNLMPLIQEKDLYHDFNNKCGNIQFLEEIINDNYVNLEDKIKQFLQTISLDKNFLNDLKNAFKNKVFISYRRSDKPLLKQISDVINEDNYLYDLGIWYDEFLTVGNKYDPEINTQIKSSNIFVLMVTDRLFEKDNYVLLNEYPLAVQLHKGIIPVALGDYSKDKYHELFPGLEDPIDVFKMKERIINALKDVEKDARHDFLVGYCYLYGIYTIKNVEKAKMAFLKHEDDVSCAESLAIYYETYEPEDIESICKYSKVVMEYDLNKHPDKLCSSIFYHIMRLTKLYQAKEEGEDEILELCHYCFEFAKNHEIDEQTYKTISFVTANAYSLLGIKIPKEIYRNMGVGNNEQDVSCLASNGEIKDCLRNNEIEQAKDAIQSFITRLNKLKDEDAYNVISENDFSHFADIYFYGLTTGCIDDSLWDKYLSMMYDNIDDDSVQFPLIIASMNEGKKLLKLIKQSAYIDTSLVNRIATFTEKVDKITTEKETVFRATLYLQYFFIIVYGDYRYLDINEKVTWLKDQYLKADREDLKENNLTALMMAAKYYHINHDDYNALATQDFVLKQKNGI